MRVYICSDLNLVTRKVTEWSNEAQDWKDANPRKRIVEVWEVDGVFIEYLPETGMREKIAAMIER